MTDEARAKGILFFYLNDYLTRYHGLDAVDRVCALLNPAAAQNLRNPVAHEWYRHADYLDAEWRTLEVFYGGDIQQASRLGKYSMGQAINVVYRFLFQFLNPEVLINRSVMLWRTFIDRGDIKIQRLGPTLIQIHVENFRPSHQVWCHEMRGVLEAELDVCKIPVARRTLEEVECLFRGDNRCCFKVGW